MGARHSRRSVGLDDERGIGDRGKGVVRGLPPEENTTARNLNASSDGAAGENNISGIDAMTPQKPLQLRQQQQPQNMKPVQNGSEGGVDKRRESNQRLINDPKIGDGDRGRIMIVGGKATASARAEGAGPNQAGEESEDPIVDEEASKQAAKNQQLTELAELVQAEIDRAAKAQVLEHLKERTAHAFQEASDLREELERTEAAVVGGKKKRDIDVAERETQLKLYEEEIRRLEAEGAYLRSQLTRSVNAETQLANELKRTQESLLFLSAWDEEKIELEAEVATLKSQLSSAIEEGKNRLERTQQDFNIASAMAGQKAQLRLARDAEKIRLDLEKGLSEEFRSLRRETEVLRREKAHKDAETNRIMRKATQIERDQRTARVELADERRMHQTTIRRRKRAEAVIDNLQTQLTVALAPASGRTYSPSNSSASPRPPKKPWNSPRRPATHGRGKNLVRQCDEGGGRDGAHGETLPGAGPGNGPGTSRSFSKVSMLLVPPRTPQEQEEGQEEIGGWDSEGTASGCVRQEAAAMGSASRADLELPLENGGNSNSERPTYRKGASVGEKSGLVISGGRAVRGHNECGITESGSSGLRVGGGGGGGGEGQEGDQIPELITSGSGTKISSGDVWGMLDSYVHRRSEVARAKRHLGVIEVMRKHLEKSNARRGNPTGSNCSSITARDNQGRGLRRVRVGGDETTCSGEVDEAVWKASRPKRSWQDRQPDDTSCTNGRRARNKKAVCTTPRRPRVRLKPRPLPRCKRDESETSVSQITAVRFWKECGAGEQHSTAGMRLRPAVSGDAGRGATDTTEGRQDAIKNTASCSGGRHHDNGRRPRRAGRLTSPSSLDAATTANGGSSSLPFTGGSEATAVDDIIAIAEDLHREGEDMMSAMTEVISRSPSPTTRPAEVVGVARFGAGVAAAAAGRCFGKGVTTGGGRFPPPRRRRRHDPIPGGGRRKAAASLGLKRHSELTDWIETNTNLVNVCPW
ncbi:unnamed protein product [Ectocarpus sp. 4 AP-2014]